MRIELVPSGVECVDAQLGGLALRQICLIVGTPRSGRTCLAMQFLVSALQRNEPCCLVTNDNPESVLAFAEQYLEHDLKPSVRNRKLTLLSFGPAFESKIRTLGGVDKPFAEFGLLARERGLRHLVVDSFDPILAATDATNLKQFIRSIVGAAGQLGLTCVWTALAAESGALKMGAEELASQVSCTLELHEENGQRKLVLGEVSWCTPDNSTISFDLVHGKGIVATGVTSRPAAALRPVRAPAPLDQVHTVMMEGMSDAMRKALAAPGPAQPPSTAAGEIDAPPAPAMDAPPAAAPPAAARADRTPPRQTGTGLGDVLQNIEKQYLTFGEAAQKKDPRGGSGGH